MRIGTNNFARTWNDMATFYYIRDGWCTHCEKAPDQIIHAGYLWNIKYRNATAAQLFRLKYDERKTHLILISKDCSEIAIYRRGAAGYEDKEADISVEKPVGRLSDMLAEYHKMKEENNK